ncbi:MAG: hypothetical protein HOL66_16430 [Rhodospirillaceae bacterium]|nr:hypothetical protein [Rhodospirillaceae bacterium]MBT6406455.1 hypothetical protein [Rhodospirillaceae bacterium]MBT7138558.1 hypothetical protein [Rhodospirillaceae bacterium]
MADYMFPKDPPQAPGEFVDALMTDGGASFMDAMEDGMQAFANAMSDGGDMAAAGDVFMSTMTDHCANADIPGMSPDMFEAAADAFAEVAGPALMGMPQDAGPADMAACFQDAANMMMPPAMDVPPEMADMFDMMADTMDDCGCGPHEMGEAFGPPMPDGFVPGDPGTYPDGDFMPPPGDAPMDGEPGPMAPPDPDGTMMGDAPMDGEPGPMAPPDPDGTMMGDGHMPGGPAPIDAGAMASAADALGGALGGAPPAGPPPTDPGAAADAAIGAAMDGAMDQGGPAPGSPPDPAPVADTGLPADMPDEPAPDDDPTAGMA